MQEAGKRGRVELLFEVLVGDFVSFRKEVHCSALTQNFASFSSTSDAGPAICMKACRLASNSGLSGGSLNPSGMSYTKLF